MILFWSVLLLFFNHYRHFFVKSFYTAKQDEPVGHVLVSVVSNVIKTKGYLFFYVHVRNTHVCGYTVCVCVCVCV